MRRQRMFSPGYLVWTYKSSPGAGYPLLSYPYDVKVLSIGFLTWYVHEYQPIHIDVAPEECYAEWGDEDTMERLLSTLRDLSDQTKHGQTTSWCYGIKFRWDWMNNIFYRFVRRDFTGYMCSTSPENPSQFNEVIQETEFLFFLQICSVIIFCYSPLLLYLFDENPGDKSNTTSKVTKDANDHQTVREDAEDGTSVSCSCRQNTVGIDENDYFFEKGEPPISIFNPFNWCAKKIKNTTKSKPNEPRKGATTEFDEKLKTSIRKYWEIPDDVGNDGGRDDQDETNA
ncbi:unnamed protein product [Owenia fusiformis]|uniref:Uncharacterized protein n=1 Tax=Owenia fusiformis TaxID=6347 RepID=A0A8J1XNY1_OWEFU|nr:unnamed protein product [Owenia fusiformis]